MGIKAGLVGLPNVGKSTLFNALTKSSVPAENYPFCTIDPHLAIAEVPDTRIPKLTELYQSQKEIPATVQFVDIAGLVKGAASGEGLGNQFLSHIREVDLILHVLRCFEDPNINYSGTELDPLGDYEIIVSELMLKDLESVEKRLQKVGSLMKAAQNKPAEKKELEAELALLKKLEAALNDLNHEDVLSILKNNDATTIPLLCAKKFLVIANVAEDELDGEEYNNNPLYQAVVNRFGKERVIPISAKIEYELSQMEEESDRQEIMGLIGLEEPGLNKIIRQTYHNLNLITFFTCGPKEIHAWPIPQGMNVRHAGGEIHSDLERGFICAEVFSADDLFEHGSLAKLKEVGKIRTEGQDYIVQDGDIVLIRFNV